MKKEKKRKKIEKRRGKKGGKRGKKGEKGGKKGKKGKKEMVKKRKKKKIIITTTDCVCSLTYFCPTGHCGRPRRYFSLRSKRANSFAQATAPRYWRSLSAIVKPSSCRWSATRGVEGLRSGSTLV